MLVRQNSFTRRDGVGHSNVAIYFPKAKVKLVKQRSELSEKNITKRVDIVRIGENFMRWEVLDGTIT
jgi:hypothetical protein